MNQIESYLQSKGWGFKLRNGEYCLDECPFCNAGPQHFYIGKENEQYYCQKCQAKGHLLSLKKKLGDLPSVAHISEFSDSKIPPKTIDLSIVEKYHKDLLENPVILAYLTEERAFKLETIKKFKLGFKDDKEKGRAITIPHFRDGLCLNIKYRYIKPIGDKKYDRETGYPSILFNLDNAKKYPDGIIVNEGELDAIAYDQMGFPNVVSGTTGAGSFAGEWVDDLEEFDQVYISFDMDGPGQEGAEKVANKLGRYRCRNVLLPLKDANDCLRAEYSQEEISKCLAGAKLFGSKLVVGVEHFFDEIKALYDGQKTTKAILTGWKTFDDLLKGFRPGELTVLTGETASGKTTWSINLAYKFANENHPVFIASFEMKPPTIIKKMISMESGQPAYRLTLNSLTPYFTNISSMPIYFCNQYGEMGIPELRDAVYYAHRRYGVKLVVLDHLHFFLKYSAEHERQAIDQALRDIKLWALELGIHIVLIVHPTKLTYDNKVVHLNDLKGSSGLKQIPDNVLSIWRKRDGKDLNTDHNEIVLYILKVRDDEAREGEMILNFSRNSQSYKA
jgi:twinkle protein